MAKPSSLFIHIAVLVALFAAAAVLATWRGALSPFDLRYSVMVAGAGLALLVLGWGAIWLIPVALAALMRPLAGRILLWPLCVLGFVALHWAFGPARGFVPLQTLTWPDAALLYLFPVALALVIGSALGAQVRMSRKRSHRHMQAAPASQG